MGKRIYICQWCRSSYWRSRKCRCYRCKRFKCSICRWWFCSIWWNIKVLWWKTGRRRFWFWNSTSIKWRWRIYWYARYYRFWHMDSGNTCFSKRWTWGNSLCRMAWRIDCRWNYWRCWFCSWICAANACIVFISCIFGSVWLYGKSCLYYG